MKAEISFELKNKKIGDEDVVGLIELDVVMDQKEGLKSVLQMIESLASPKVVVTFVDASEMGFYTDCGWLGGSLYDDLCFVASDSIDEDKFDGITW